MSRLIIKWGSLIILFSLLCIEQLNFSISRLVKSADSDDEDNNNSYEQQNHHHHRKNGKVTPHSEVASSCKDSCTKSRSRSSSRSRSPTRSCSVSPELEVDSPPPPLRMNESPTTTNIFQVNFEEKYSLLWMLNPNELFKTERRQKIRNIFGISIIAWRWSPCTSKITTKYGIRCIPNSIIKLSTNLWSKYVAPSTIIPFISIVSSRCIRPTSKYIK